MKSIRIDVLRGCAIIMVIYFHYGYILRFNVWLDFPPSILKIMSYGWVSVDLFFVLSAFLLTKNLLRTQDEPGAMRSFYLHRIFRILPLYFLILGSAILLWRLWRPDLGGPGAWLVHNMAPTWVYSFFLQNIWIGFGDTWEAHMLSPTWSLAVEEHFYLILPIFVLFLSKKKLFHLSLILIVVSPFIRLALHYSFGGLSSSIWSIARLDSLGWGILAALAAQGGQITIQRFKTFNTIATFATLIAFVGLGIYQHLGFVNEAKAGCSAVMFSINSLIAARIILAAVAADERGAAPRNFAVMALAWAGARCYSLYLLHNPVAGLTAIAFGQITPEVESFEEAMTLVCATVILALLAELSYRFIERPFIAIGNRLSASWRENPSLTVMAK